MGDGDGVNMVHKNQLWKDRIESELKSAAEWEGAWGFLKAPRHVQKMPKSASTPTLGTAGKASLRPNTSGTDSREYFDDRMRLMDKKRTMIPKDRYGRPITVMHEYGWRSTIEKFGVSHHGVKRNPDLWPEI